MRDNKNKKRLKDIDSRRSFDRTMKKRTINIFFVCLLVGIIFIGKLIYLDTFGGTKYRKAAMEQRRKTVEIPADRGTIYDRNMNPLVRSVKVSTVYAFPKNIEEKEETAKTLSNILEIDSSGILEKLESDRDTVKIISNISKEQIDSIRESKLRGISISNESGRYYTSSSENNAGSGVLGFVDFENNGVAGIEKAFNQELKGVPGLNIFSKSGEGQGNSIPYEDNKINEPTKGENLQLTIDEAIQGAANRAGKKTMEEFNLKNLSIIVTKPKTGEILALENFPNYDPNNPRQPRNDAERDEMESLSGDDLLKKYYDMWRSYSVSDVYEPGSVFKAITTAAAIEEGTASEDSKYICNGYVRDIPGVVIRCHRYSNPHGEQTLQEAMNNSCNPAYVQIARDLGKDKLYKYLKAFGFGELTNIKLPGEEKGLIPENLEAIGEARLATMSYGHGIAVTPIQMITAMNAVVNGGQIMEPQLILNMLDKEDKITKKTEFNSLRQVISENTSIKLREMMEHVAEEGGANAVAIPGYHIGAKSGTSVKLENGQYTSKKTVASLYTMFPADDPEYSILVVADEPEGPNNGNAVAGPAAKMILEEIIKQKRIEPQYDIDQDIEARNIEVPNVVGLTLKDAVDKLLSIGLKSDTVNMSMNELAIVKYQYPQATEKVKKGTAISLTADDSGTVMVQMPKLKGRTINYVETMLNKINIKFEIVGHSTGKVIKTDPVAGDMVDPEATVKIVFFDPEKEKNQDENNRQNNGENNQNQDENENSSVDNNQNDNQEEQNNQNTENR